MSGTSATPEQVVFRLCYLKQQQRLIVPTDRLELQKSPYPEFTQQQLDMRRKAEILKYAANKQNTKTNVVTKAQTFANKMRQTGTISQATLNLIARNTCADLATIPTPSSSCDIPGPVFIMRNDPTIPLYNYTAKTNNQPKVT